MNPTSRTQTLSVVLMTKNEESRLDTCLKRAFGWADEIVIIDDVSTDKTREAAARYTDKIFVMESEDDHYRQWNRGIERSSCDWILHIDADELITDELKEAIDAKLSKSCPEAAFRVMRKNFF